MPFVWMVELGQCLIQVLFKSDLCPELYKRQLLCKQVIYKYVKKQITGNVLNRKHSLLYFFHLCLNTIGDGKIYAKSEFHCVRLSC